MCLLRETGKLWGLTPIILRGNWNINWQSEIKIFKWVSNTVYGSEYQAMSIMANAKKIVLAVTEIKRPVQILT